MPERNWGCRVSLDHAYKGYRLAVLENDELRVAVLLDKGADIVEFQHKPSGTDYMWWTPWGLPGPSHPSDPQDLGGLEPPWVLPDPGDLQAPADRRLP